MHRINLILFVFSVACATASQSVPQQDYGRVGHPFGHLDVRHDEPTVACLSAPSATPEEHLVAWRSALHEFATRPYEDPGVMSRQQITEYYALEPARAYAEALPHALGSGDHQTACHALFIVRNIAAHPCEMQSLQTRAILRCYLDELDTACPDGSDPLSHDHLARQARRALFESGCYTDDGWYNP